MKFEKNPDKRYRAIPFWSLNGKLEEKELREQIGIMEQMGFGGAFIHSRTGLATEYMSEEWLRLVKACCEELQSRGLDAWLYDEDRWPSGTCGGAVAENPQYRRAFISARFLSRDKFELGDCGLEFIAAFAVKLSGQTYAERAEDMPPYSGMNLDDYFPITDRMQIPDGYTAMIFSQELMESNEFYNGYAYIDTLSKEPTELFLKLTHEKYRESMGGMFGSVIKGIFTDEPHRGPVLNGFGISNANGLAMLPYTRKLFDEYKKRFSEELREKLPELYFKTGNDNFSRTSWRYIETLQSLFLRNFAQPIKKWCDKNDMILTGHVLHEDCLSAQTTMAGSVMRYYEHMTYPGLDNLGSENNCYVAAIAVSSAAKQLGKKYVLSEMYGATGWKTTFDEYKQIGDWQALLGVNLRCPHLSWYTMKGEAKRDYPASINKQANWFREYRAVEDYFARLGRVLTEAKPITDTLVFSPVESAWGLTHMGIYYDCFAVRDEEYKRLECEFAALTQKLLYAGVDFDYADEEMAGRLAKAGRDEYGAFVRLGKMKYRKIILPFMINLRSSTAELLREFVACGGKILVCESYPTHIDGERAEFAFGGAFVGSSDEICKDSSADLLAQIESDGDFMCKCKRADKNEYVLFCINTDRKNGHKAKIKFRGVFNAEKWNLRNGGTEGINFCHKDGFTVVEFDFARGEELMLHFTERKTAPQKIMEMKEKSVSDVPMCYSLSQPNVLVLDRAECFVNGEYFCKDELLKIDERLREKFGLGQRGGEMVQPWFKKKYRGDYNESVARIALEFSFDADYIPPEILFAAEDYDKISLTVNGADADAEIVRNHTLAKTADICFTFASISGEKFRKGRNVIKIEFNFSDSFDIENYYIYGYFAVHAGLPCKIAELPETVKFGDLCSMGFPFYAGDITYELQSANGDWEDGEYVVKLSDFYAACIKAGENVHAFAPFEPSVRAENGKLKIKATLTPKNEFGPLHEVPPLLPICAPSDFRTSGDRWSDGYSLLPQGIFSPPKVYKIMKKS